MLPNIHYQDGIKAGDVAGFVKRYPVIGQPAIRRVLITNGPTDTAHFADTNKVGFPNFITAERRRGSLRKLRVRSRVACAAALLQIIEVILVQHHPAVPAAKPPASLSLTRPH